jgi:hypothetical protein
MARITHALRFLSPPFSERIADLTDLIDSVCVTEFRLGLRASVSIAEKQLENWLALQVGMCEL